MPNFPYVENKNAPKDVFIEKVQRMLNDLRKRSHYPWSNLKVDGYYGPETAGAVKAFQSKKTGRGDGILDRKTYEQIDKELTVLSPILTHYVGNGVVEKRIEKEDPIIVTFADHFMDVLKELDSIINEEIQYAKSLGKFEAKMIAQRFSYHISKLDPQIKRLQQLFKINIESKNVIDSLSANANHKRSSKDSFSQRKNKIDNQSRVSRYQMKVNYTSKQGEKISKDFIRGLEKMNLLGKIENRIKQIGITGNLKVGDLKNIKVKAGGVFLVYSLKDIICDLLKYEEWGEENWKQKLLDDCFKFLDNLIIGFISTIIAQLIVTLAASAIAATGIITISGGWIIALVVILALIFGLIIGSFIKKVCDDDASISKFIYEGSVTNILNVLYSM